MDNTTLDRALYYMTRRESLGTILEKRCILAVSERDPKDAFKEIWAPSFVAKRQKITLPFGAKLFLDDLVPLHVTSRTPAALNLASGMGVERVPNTDLVVFRTTAKRLLEHFQPFAVVNAQPLAACARYFAGEEGLGEIDWRVAASSDFRRDPDDPTKGARAGAEVLVPYAVSLQSFDAVLCWDGEVELAAVLAREPAAAHLAVVRQRAAFFAQGA